jgi:hypothetical protein
MGRQAGPAAQLADLWRNLGAGSKVTLSLAGAALIALLASWYAREPPTPNPHRFSTSPGKPPSETTSAAQPQRWAVPIATPLGRQRDAAAAELEDTLSQMEGVEKARVTLNRPDPAPYAGEEPSASAAICLWFEPEACPSEAMVEGIVGYLCRAVPELRRDSITIVDGAGRTLFADGQAVSATLRLLASERVAAAEDRPTRPLWALGRAEGALLVCLAALLALLAALMTLRGRGGNARGASRADEPSAAGPTPQASAYMSGFEPAAMVAALAAERPQVVAFALSRMAPAAAAEVGGGLPEALRREVNLRLAASGEVAPVIAAAAERALLQCAERALLATPDHSVDRSSADGGT